MGEFIRTIVSDHFEVILGSVLLPFFSFLFWILLTPWRARQKRKAEKERKAELIEDFFSLPPNCQRILGQFAHQNCRIMPLPNRHPDVETLHCNGYLEMQDSVFHEGQYKHNYKIRLDVFNVLKEQIESERFLQEGLHG